MKAVWLIHELTERGIGHFIGVPDSTLSDFCKCLERQYADCHEVPANEGAAVALAAGHYLAEQKPCLVYMQNSGIGNAVNPICSHMGCVLEWNRDENSWDCPCHGSRYDYTGRLLSGPAIQPLETNAAE